PLLPPPPVGGGASRPYGRPAVLAALAEAAERRLAADGIDPTHLAVVHGALDGVERSLSAWLRPGQTVAVEDPAYAAVLDLLAAMGLEPVPVAVDAEGMVPAALERALAGDVAALVATPRAHNPTGAAWTDARAAGLAEILAGRPDVLVVEDDHAGQAAGVEARTLTTDRERWASVRSVSKTLGPDLRLAVLAGDGATVARVEGRQALGPGWVSYLVQALVARLWAEPGTSALLERAARTYGARRQALVDELALVGVEAPAPSGLNVWVPVREEHPVVSGLLERGWAVAPGERFRIASPPGIRITTATLTADESRRLAGDLAGCLSRRGGRQG
ncbi:MAG: aminotransferase class I/II-fold pyridoxal phosphate-dependent enzyme, partial [Acidimicrobiales bacterium]